jgi:RNA polymerase sigma-70 factor (ECF subfamily)
MEINDSARESWPALMEQAQAGDQLAYTRLLKALVPVIRSQIRKRIADDALVEDVIQDVLLTVHRVRHTYDPSYPFLPWLMAIISARAVDALRRRGRYQQWEIPKRRCRNRQRQQIRKSGIVGRSWRAICASSPPANEPLWSMSICAK